MKIQSICRLVCLSFLTIIVLCCLGCSDDTNPPGPGNPDAPFIPTNNSPPDGSRNQPLQLTLCWSCADPNGDSLTYDVYFGIKSPPPLVDSAIVDTVYDTPILTPDSVYYWFVVAKDPMGNKASSPIWSFTPISSSSFIYPLNVGNRWEYAGEYIIFNISFDSVQPPLGVDTMRSTSVVRITAVDKFFDTLEIYKFHEKFVQWNNNYHSDYYFCNLDNGFYSFGSSNSSGSHTIPLKIQPKDYYRLQGKNYYTVYAILEDIGARVNITAKISDSISYENPPLKCLQYPLEIGTQWNFRTTVDHRRIDKKILDLHNVNVPAGEFSCFDILWLWDLDGDGEWEEDVARNDNISRYGLISRHTLIRGIEIIDYMTGEVLGTFDVEENFILTDYQVR